MESFIEEVVNDVWKNYSNISTLVFVMPSKRSGNFLKTAIQQRAGKTIVSPRIYSIEDFVENISGLTAATSLQQLFTLYDAYTLTGNYDKDSFDIFLTWGNTLLQDFNEVDRYLINTQDLYKSIGAIQELNHWSLKAEKTTLVNNYIAFWNSLGAVYEKFTQLLLDKNLGHQGLLYRKAVENLPSFISSHSPSFIFLGFNALNRAEATIIETILDETKSEIYWDSDPYFIDDEMHDAGLFIRQHKRKWKSLQHKPLKGLSTHYLEQKQIQIIGTPKNVPQAKLVGNLLDDLQKSGANLQHTAVILADETLLNPLLNAIPPSIQNLNITMGQKLADTPMASFFLAYLDLNDGLTPQGIFYKEFLRFLYHPFTSYLFDSKSTLKDTIITTIKERNVIYITKEHLDSWTQNNTLLVSLFFTPKEKLPIDVLHKIQTIITLLKEKLQDSQDRVVVEQLYRFYNVFNQLSSVISQKGYLNTIATLKHLYRELLALETIDFKGDPLNGLQIMGMLESRSLDFETVILTSVNEGILPSGKTGNSFIPFDVKITFDLPTYKEKDAVYTYHFYRLLQRAKKVFILFNTEPDVLMGGEPSRLIAQLLTDPNRKDITEKTASPIIRPVVKQLQIIPKTTRLQELIRQYAEKGFSPTSLTNYIRNPIDFYTQNLLGIQESEIVEETLAANTFGTIVHDSLEALYTPFIGENLTSTAVANLKKHIAPIVQANVKRIFKEGSMATGKNYLSQHVIIKYIEKFIDIELEELKHHNVRLLGLEQNLKVKIEVPGIEYPLFLKGKLDRIDHMDGVTRIIDYKTGRVEPRNVQVNDWQQLTQEYSYSKAFQLLCYALLYTNTHTTDTLKAAIISFKNLKAGTQYFATKEAARSQTKNEVIDSATLQLFQQQLTRLMAEICNPEKPFEEKEV